MAFHTIIGIDSGTNAIVLGGVDVVARLPSLSRVRVSGSTTGIDGFYTVQLATLVGANTHVQVIETLPSASGDGLLQDGTYDINFYTAPAIDGSKTPFTVIPLALDTGKSSLKFPGRQYEGYGEVLIENYIHSLENFAGPTAPPYPTTGQLWYDTTSVNQLKLYEHSTTSWIDVLMGENDQTLNNGSFTITNGNVNVTAGDVAVTAGDIFTNNGQVKATSSTEAAVITQHNTSAFYVFNNANDHGLFSSTLGGTLVHEKSTGTLSLRDKLNIVDDGIEILSTTEGQTKLEIGQGRTTDGYAFVDLIGDSTYTDYGLRMIRNNTGLNANSELIHRGTGQFIFTSPELSSFRFNIAGLADSLIMTQNNAQINKPNTANIATLRVNNPLGNNSYGIVGEFVISDNSPSTIDKPSILFTSNEGGITTTWSVGYGSGSGAGPSDRYFRIRENHTPAVGWGAERFRLGTSTIGGGFAGNDFVLGFEVTARGDSGASRALVKETGNRLFINYAGDYTGGTVINSDLTVTGTTNLSGGTSFSSLELTSATPYIDFKDNPAEDYDARIIRNTTGTGGLDFVFSTSGPLLRWTWGAGAPSYEISPSLFNMESGPILRLKISPDRQPLNAGLQFGNSNRMTIGDHSGHIHHHAIIGHTFAAGAPSNQNDPSFERLKVTEPGVTIGNNTNTPIRQINHISQMYAGYIIGQSNSLAGMPDGWGLTYGVGGNYRYVVTHNLNTTNYAVVFGNALFVNIWSSNTQNVNYFNKQANSFEIVTAGGGTDGIEPVHEISFMVIVL